MLSQVFHVNWIFYKVGNSPFNDCFKTFPNASAIMRYMADLKFHSETILMISWCHFIPWCDLAFIFLDKICLQKLWDKPLYYNAFINKLVVFVKRPLHINII